MAKATIRARVPVRPLLTALTAAALLTLLLASSASALPGRFWGVVPQASPNDEQLQRLKRGGVRSVRVPLNWGGMQPNRNDPIDFSIFDPIVERTANAGLELLPFVSGAPHWAVPSVKVPGTGGGEAVARLPVRGQALNGWRNLLRKLVQRYGPKGRFWVENPSVPKLPIRTWQLWNEQNFKYFAAHPNPAEYAKLVKFSYPTIKNADPGARVILGGMFALPKGCQKSKHPQSPCADDFLERMYRSTPGLKGRFDGIALHPYSAKFQYLTPMIEELRAVLVRNRDAGKGLWITELGWSSKPPTPGNSFAKGINGQRNQLRGAFKLLKRKQRQWRIQRVYWFSVDDQEGSCNFCDGSGLFSEGFEPKKSWYAYVHFAGGRP